MNDNTKPNPADFIVNEKHGQYRATFDVRGTITMMFKADSLEDAKEKAEAMCDEEDFGFDIDDVDEVVVGYVCKMTPMYLVMREGREMQTSHLKVGDTPRQPNEDGF